MKPIKLYTDLSVRLYEGEAAKKRGTPITYLTQWKIVGNSEVHGQEIWSCGEYNPTDGKYHILVQPLGGSIADIALTEPLRKYNDVADTIEFPSETEGKALVTRNLDTTNFGDLQWSQQLITSKGVYRQITLSIGDKAKRPSSSSVPNFLCILYTPTTYSNQVSNLQDKSIMMSTAGYLSVYDTDYNQNGDTNAFTTAIDGVELIYELATPTTEFVDAPQIQEAESYICVISQGAKTVSWSRFETD